MKELKEFFKHDVAYHYDKIQQKHNYIFSKLPSANDASLDANEKKQFVNVVRDGNNESLKSLSDFTLGVMYDNLYTSLYFCKQVCESIYGWGGVIERKEKDFDELVELFKGDKNHIIKL